MKKINSAIAAKVLLLAATAFEICILIYFNFFKVKYAVDQDYAQLLFHAMQMSDKNEILLHDWFYSTTGEFDCPMLLAALFVKIFGNPYYAFALSNLINLVVWIFVLNILMDNVGASIYGKLVAFCLVFTTYDFSILAYTNMMFIRGSQYTMKVLLPVMFVAMLTFPKESLKSVKNIVLNVLFYFMAFLTAFSSGTYVFLCGFSPIIVCVLIYYVLNKECKQRKFYLFNVLGVTAATVLGIVFERAFDITNKSDGFTIRNDIDIVKALSNSIGDVFWAFRLFPDYPVSVSSPEAIGVVIRWGVIALICFGFASVKKAFAIDAYGKKEIKCDERSFATASLISVFVFTVLLLTLIPSRIRYQLIGIIPLLIVASMNIENWQNKLQENYRAAFYIFFGALFIANSAFSISVDGKQWFNGEKSEYQVNYDENAEIKSILDNLGADVAYVFEDNRLRAGLTLTDPERRYTTCTASGEIWIGWDNYMTIDKGGNPDFGHRNAVIYNPEKGDKPEFVDAGYSYICNVGEYEIYFSDVNGLE